MNDTKQVKCLLLDDDSMDFEYTKHCLQQVFGADQLKIDHVATIEQAETALLAERYDVALLDYYVGPRTPMSLLRHFDGAQSDCVVLVLSSVHPTIVKPFLDAVGKGAFMDKTAFSARALSSALAKAGFKLDQAVATSGSRSAPNLSFVNENIA